MSLIGWTVVLVVVVFLESGTLKALQSVPALTVVRVG